MTALKWVRLDSAFPMNHKIVTLVQQGRHRAITVYCCGLAYAGGQGTDGWIPDAALPWLHGRRVDAAHLVEANLWVPRPGGWDIHDWCEYQPSSEETALRSERARAAALTRWAQTPTKPHARRNA